MSELVRRSLEQIAADCERDRHRNATDFPRAFGRNHTTDRQGSLLGPLAASEVQSHDRGCVVRVLESSDACLLMGHA
jgi:hypothetical protein